MPEVVLYGLVGVFALQFGLCLWLLWRVGRFQRELRALEGRADWAHQRLLDLEESILWLRSWHHHFSSAPYLPKFRDHGGMLRDKDQQKGAA